MRAYRFQWVLAALAALALACAGQRPPTSTQRASTGSPATAAANTDVLALIADYDRAWNAKDRARLNEILDPSYLYFTSTGAVWSRDRVLGMVLSPEYRLGSAKRSELLVHGDGLAATVSSRWIGAGTFKDHAFTDDQRCGLTVIRRRDRLVLLAEHCTQIAP
jgi:hypothetical protein